MVSRKDKVNSHIKDLLLLFLVPISTVVLAAVVIYIPRIFANPKYDFIYSVCDDYRCNNSFSVDSKGYTTQDYLQTSDQNYYYNTSYLRYYDAQNDATRSLTIEEAREYKLNTSSKSPDGYTLVRESSSSGFLFWGDYKDGWFLKNGSKKKKVDLINDGYYYSNDINFLGWVN